MRFKSSTFHVNSDDPFANDQFGRKSTVEFLSDIIEKSGGPFVLALDSPWGTGKTVTVQMLKAHLEISGFTCVYFDAWRADYVSDPLLALLGALDELNFSKSPLANQHFNAVRKLAGSVGRRLLMGGVRAATGGIVDGKMYEDVISDLASGTTQDLIDLFSKEQQNLEKIREELEQAVRELQKVEGKKKTLIFFIDELDRCRPDFALSVLERIKHLFDLADIHFVLSIDKAQLESSVSAVHGQKINSSEYLRRFFDLEFGLPDGDSKAFTNFLVKDLGLEDYFAQRKGTLSYDKDNFIDCFSAMASLFSLSLRTREKCLTRMVVVISQTPIDRRIDPELTSFLIILRAMDPAYFKALINGSVSTEDVADYIRAKEGGIDFMQQHMGAVLYGLLIAHHSKEEIWMNESTMLTHKFHNVSGGPDPKIVDWVETAMSVVREQGGRRQRRTIRFMAEKIDLSARLSN